MSRFAALFLMFFYLDLHSVHAQDSVEFWSKKVVELQSQEGQNFEQDLQLAKGYLYLQRRQEAQDLLNRLLKMNGRSNSPRLKELRDTALDQFFHQESAENFAEALQLIRADHYSEARELILSALQKEKRHRLLVLRAIQVSLALKRWNEAEDYLVQGEQAFPESVPLKIFRAWWHLAKGDLKNAGRMINLLFNSEKAWIERNEIAVLIWFQSMEVLKKQAEGVQWSKLVSRHPEWVGIRYWQWANSNPKKPVDDKEAKKLKDLFKEGSKLDSLREKEEKQNSFIFRGLISLEEIRKKLNEHPTGKDQ